MIAHALFAVALHLAPCDIAGAKARCGTFDVPESAQSKRTLHLKLIVLPATEHNDSPVFVFGGGPGIPATSGAEIEVKLFAAERRLHDVVLLDQRGTEGSALCPKAVKAHVRQEVEDDLFPPALVADCRREIEAHADLAHFTTNDFVDDVEAARTALGYGPINIVGLSYGTRVALVYEAKYPNSVRSMLLNGPLPPENLMPLNAARDAQLVLDRQSSLGDALDAMSKLPKDIKSGGYTIHMSRGAFGEFLRTQMYTADGIKKVPEMLKEAKSGDWSKIAPAFIQYRRSWYDPLGVLLSVTCPADVRNIQVIEVGPASARTFLGDYRVQRQMAACAAWTPGVLPVARISTAPVPILILVGDRDVVTPKRWADIIASHAPRTHTVVLPNSGHGDFGGECGAKLEIAFFDAGSFDKLDESCAQNP